MVRINQSELDMINAGNEIKKPGKNKFGAKKVIIDGIKFDSIKEGNRYLDLKLQEHTGLIKNLYRIDLIKSRESIWITPYWL